MQQIDVTNAVIDFGVGCGVCYVWLRISRAIVMARRSSARAARDPHDTGKDVSPVPGG
jgi:hypothetical protein